MPNAFNAQSMRPDFAEALWRTMERGNTDESPSAFQPGFSANAVGFNPFDDVQSLGVRTTNRERDLMLLGIAVTPAMRLGNSETQFPIDAAVLVSNQPHAGEIAMPSVSGTTRNGDGSTLGSVEVRAYYIGGEATQTLGTFIKVTTSDGSGAWSMDLAPGDYQFDGYLFGSPDRAGTTKVSVVSPSTSVNIYMRDPTAADAAGSASYRVIGSPVVRRLDR